MAQKLCIIHANCQGDTLRYLLEGTPAFAQDYSIKKFTNYLHEDIAEADLQNCDLFLYQRLDAKWGELATETLLQKLNSAAQTLEIPNMFFNGYWPLWTNKTFMSYGDMLLEELCTRDLSIAEIMHLYIRGNLAQKYDLNALRAASLVKEKAKEASMIVKTLPYIDAHWREEQLFYTVNHPAPRLSLYVADKILQHLGYDGVYDVARLTLMQHKEEFIQPIHPQVGTFYDLPFANEQRQYPTYGQNMNFQTYTNAYVHCRRQEGQDAIKDFVVYLHLLAQNAQQEHI